MAAARGCRYARAQMKTTKTCPKCAGKKLWVVDPLQTVHEYAPGTLPLHLAYKQKTGDTGWLASKTERVGRLAAWICAACGFSELWASELEQLQPDPEAGIRLVDGSEGPARGYR